MKKQFLTIVMAVLVLGLAQTATADTADSTTWENAYEGDVMPDTVGWTSNMNGAAYSTIVNGEYLNLNTTTATEKRPEWGIFAGAWSAVGTGSSVEYRVRLNGSKAETDNLFLVNAFRMETVGMAGGDWYVSSIQPAGWTVLNAHKYTLAGVHALTNLTFNQWHTYRVTSSYDSAVDTEVTITLYLDDDPLPQTSFTLAPGADPDKMIIFGGGANFSWTDFDLDYVRWTNQGAFPVPEPATMALLGIGGLALLRRRRK